MAYTESPSRDGAFDGVAERDAIESVGRWVAVQDGEEVLANKRITPATPRLQQAVRGRPYVQRRRNDQGWNGRKIEDLGHGQDSFVERFVFFSSGETDLWKHDSTSPEVA